MDWLEEELKKALQREMPSPGFASRVAAMAGERRRSARRAPWRSWMAAAAALLLASGGSLEYREYRGRMAKQRVLLALRITADRLNYIQVHAQKAPQRTPHPQNKPAEVRQ